MTSATAALPSILLRPTSLVLVDNMTASSSSASSSSLSSHRPRIRFAPLPEPRRGNDSLCSDGEDDDNDDDNETASDSETLSEEHHCVVAPSPISPTLSMQSAPPVQSVSRVSRLLRLLRPSTPTSLQREDSFRPRSRSPPPSSPSSTARYRPTTPSDDSQASATKASRRHSAPPLGAGGGRHSFASKLLPGPSPLAQPPVSPSSSSSPSTRGKSNRKPKYVRMLNGRVYGTKRHPVHSNANPFASARDEPEFVEWGYGGMGSVRASGEVANSVWKGLHANGNSGASSHKTTALGAGGGRSTASARRHMTQAAPECGMGNVDAGNGDEDDGSGMGWVKRRRAEREQKLRAEREARERAEREAGEDEKEPRKSGESMTGDQTTAEHKDASHQQHHKEHHVLTVRRPLTNKQVESGEPSPVDSKAPSSPGEDDEDEEALDTHSRMALGAGVEKVSKHVSGGGGDP
ncbi:hypothetical protein EDC04DRAFT_2695285 [Pisolithus marmoratus]|nr:hypothetical protein EDC04DRAFT_2695285 [Pisolithus marmoratus]